MSPRLVRPTDQHPLPPNHAAAWFSGTQFSGVAAGFNRVQFTGVAALDSAQFTGDAGFSQAAGENGEARSRPPTTWPRAEGSGAMRSGVALGLSPAGRPPPALPTWRADLWSLPWTRIGQTPPEVDR